MDQEFSAFDLEQGVTYEVIQSFEDFDGIVHAVGEKWCYVSLNFFPYDSGLTLYFEKGRIRLQDYEEAQGRIIQRFHQYLRRVS